MLDGQDVSNPILHIQAIKNIQNNMDGMTRYKVTLADGESQHNCKKTLDLYKSLRNILYYDLELIQLAFWPRRKILLSKVVK